MTTVTVFLTLILSTIHAYSPCDTLDITVLFDPRHVLDPTIDITTQVLKNILKDISYESSLRLIPHAIGYAHADSDKATDHKMLIYKSFYVDLQGTHHIKEARSKALKRLTSYLDAISTAATIHKDVRFITRDGKEVFEHLKSKIADEEPDPQQRRSSVIISLNRWYPESTRSSLKPVKARLGGFKRGHPFTFIFDYNYNHAFYEHLEENKYDSGGRKKYLRGSPKDKFIYYGASIKKHVHGSDTITEYQQSDEWKLIGKEEEKHTINMQNPKILSGYLREKVYRVICPQNDMWRKSDELKPKDLDFQLARGVEILQKGDIIKCDLHFDAGTFFKVSSAESSTIRVPKPKENRYRFKEGTILVAPHAYYNSQEYKTTGCGGKLYRSHARGPADAGFDAFVKETIGAADKEHGVWSRGSAVFQIKKTRDLGEFLELTVTEPTSLSNIVSVIQKPHKATRRRLTTRSINLSGSATKKGEKMFERKWSGAKNRKWTSPLGWPTFKVEGDAEAHVKAGYSYGLKVGFDFDWRSDGKDDVSFNLKLYGNFSFGAYFELFLSPDVTLIAQDLPRISIGIPLPIPMVPIRVFPFLAMDVDVQLTFALKYRYDYFYNRYVELGYKYTKRTQRIGSWRLVSNINKLSDEDRQILHVSDEVQCKLRGVNSCGVNRDESCAFVEFHIAKDKEFNCYLYHKNGETWWDRIHSRLKSETRVVDDILHEITEEDHTFNRWLFTGLLSMMPEEHADNGAYCEYSPPKKIYESKLGFVNDASDSKMDKCPAVGSHKKINFKVSVKAGVTILNEILSGYVEFVVLGSLFVHIPMTNNHPNKCVETDDTKMLSNDLCDRYHAKELDPVPSLMVGAIVKLWTGINLIFEFDPNGIIPWRLVDLGLKVYKHHDEIQGVNPQGAHTIVLKCVPITDGKSAYFDSFNEQLYENCCIKEASEVVAGKDSEPAYRYSLPTLPHIPDKLGLRPPDFDRELPHEYDQVLFDIVNAIDSPEKYFHSPERKPDSIDSAKYYKLKGKNLVKVVTDIKKKKVERRERKIGDGKYFTSKWRKPIRPIRPISAGVEYDDLIWNEFEGKETENKYAVRTLEIIVSMLVVFCICFTGLCVVNAYAFVWTFNGFCKKRNYLELIQHESEV